MPLTESRRRASQRSTGTISALVVDDERLAREELSYLLKDFPEIEVLQTAANGLEAVNLIAKLEPDLVFLDVQMPGLDGLGVIRKLRDEGARMPHFVLATAFDQYAVEAVRVEIGQPGLQIVHTGCANTVAVFAGAQISNLQLHAEKLCFDLTV